MITSRMFIPYRGINLLSSLIVTTVLLFCSCQATQKTASLNSGQNNSYVVASLQKTACYGRCPVYELSVSSDLTVKLEAEKNMELSGKYTSTITAPQLKALQQTFQDANFFEFEDEYSSNVSDLPTTFIFYSNGQKTKRIKDYTGAPESLRELEEYLENFVTSLTWESVEE